MTVVLYASPFISVVFFRFLLIDDADGLYTYQGSDEPDASESWDGFMVDNEFKNNEFDGGLKVQQATGITITGEETVRDKKKVLAVVYVYDFSRLFIPTKRRGIGVLRVRYTAVPHRVGSRFRCLHGESIRVFDFYSRCRIFLQLHNFLRLKGLPKVSLNRRPYIFLGQIDISSPTCSNPDVSAVQVFIAGRAGKIRRITIENRREI